VRRRSRPFGAGCETVIVGGRATQHKRPFLERLQKDGYNLLLIPVPIGASSGAVKWTEATPLVSRPSFGRNSTGTSNKPTQRLIVWFANAGIIDTPFGTTANGWCNGRRQCHWPFSFNAASYNSNQTPEVWVSSTGHNAHGGPRIDLDRIIIPNQQTRRTVTAMIIIPTRKTTMVGTRINH
jgi:hypothetical protein